MSSNAKEWQDAADLEYESLLERVFSGFGLRIIYQLDLLHVMSL